MGKMKEVFMLMREEESIQNKHLDDEYWYDKYLKEQEQIQKPVVQDSVQDSVQQKPKEQC
jgi:hypothetical protein